MAQVYTFTDANNEVRLRAEINPAPGGVYTPPTARSQYGGNNVTINNGAGGNLTWDTLNVGTALLSLTSPAQPTIVTTGVYAVTVVVGVAGAMTAGGQYEVVLDLDLNGEDPQLTVTSPAANAVETSPPSTVTGVYYLVAGAVLQVNVTNKDGVQNLPFSLGLGLLQRIS